LILFTVTDEVPEKIPRPLLCAHYLATDRAVFDQPFAARCFGCTTFGRRHPSASAFFCHNISFWFVD
jgi:hypothetical protein